MPVIPLASFRSELSKSLMFPEYPVEPVRAVCAIPVICCCHAFFMAVSGMRDGVLRRCADGLELVE